jgi:hypothetical protein
MVYTILMGLPSSVTCSDVNKVKWPGVLLVQCKQLLTLRADLYPWRG